jgi:hypothetical protein
MIGKHLETYLIRLTFGSHTEYLIEATTLEGRHDELDHPQFYCKLKLLVVNREGWSCINKVERSQDIRVCVLGFIEAVQGHSFENHEKNKAYASIANATYSGWRQQYKFQDKINTHQTAHNEILDCNPTEAVPESKKVADFLRALLTPSWNWQCQWYLETRRC